MPTIPITRTHSLVHPKGCCAFHTEFLQTQAGICKLGELIFGAICVGLMITYGTPVWMTLGMAYPLFLINSSAALLGTSVCLFSYLISANTFRAMRTTVFEIVQNSVSAILYAGGSTFLILQTSILLWPLYILIPYFQAYPALMTAGVLGCISSAIHAIDAYFAYRAFRSAR